MINLEEEKVKLKKNPYHYITEEWAEKVLPFIGAKFFSISCLMPGSLILPPIFMGSKLIDTRINFFYVAAPGTGKSSGADKYKKIAYYPFERMDISARDLQTASLRMELMSLIVADFSIFSQDYEKIKVLEAILGEEASINYSNLRVELIGETHANGMLLGTPSDLERYARQIEGGLLSRCVFIFHSLTPEEHSKIGRFINDHAGEKTYSEEMAIREQIVIEYYQDLKKIQARENNSINPVVGYHIEKEFKDKVYNIWSKLSEGLIRDLGEKSYIRDLNFYYKFLICSSFLNIYNRKIEEKEVGRDSETGEILKGSILYPNKEDHELAVKLMKENMRNKWALDKAMVLKKNLRTFEMFKKFLQSNNSPEIKNILMNISPMARFMKEEKKI